MNSWPFLNKIQKFNIDFNRKHRYAKLALPILKPRFYLHLFTTNQASDQSMEDYFRKVGQEQLVVDKRFLL